ncbi:MAG TPA: DUF2085 domain-containing protein [Pyrinomonadaceae bacterium]
MAKLLKSAIRNPHSAMVYVPQCVPAAGTQRRAVIVWATTASVALLFVSTVVIAPLALAAGHDFTALVIYRALGRVCHQIPERSFYVEGHPFAVCARCTGIYFGFAGAVLLYPLARSLKRETAPARAWLLLALVPTALDVAFDLSGLWQNTHLTRFVTGALLGAVTAFYVVPGLLDLSRLGFRRSAHPSPGVENKEGAISVRHEHKV